MQKTITPPSGWNSVDVSQISGDRVFVTAQHESGYSISTLWNRDGYGEGCHEDGPDGDAETITDQLFNAIWSQIG